MSGGGIIIIRNGTGGTKVGDHYPYEIYIRIDENLLISQSVDAGMNADKAERSVHQFERKATAVRDKLADFIENKLCLPYQSDY